MSEQVLGRYVTSEASKGDLIVTRHTTEVIRVSNDHIVALLPPAGESNISVDDDDTWFLRVEGFIPSTDYLLTWNVRATTFAGQTITTDSKGIAEVSDTIGTLVIAGLTVPATDGSSMLSVTVGDYRSEPVAYVP